MHVKRKITSSTAVKINPPDHARQKIDRARNSILNYSKKTRDCQLLFAIFPFGTITVPRKPADAQEKWHLGKI